MTTQLAKQLRRGHVGAGEILTSPGFLLRALKTTVDTGGLVGDNGAWPDEGHLPAEHIEQLGHLVQAGRAQEAPYPGDAGVIVELEQRRVDVVLLAQVDLHLVGTELHRSELAYPEDPALVAHPVLAEKDGARRSCLDSDGHERHQRREQQ